MLAAVLQEISEFERRVRAETADGKIAPPTVESRMGVSLDPGARVFDLVTGQEAEVIAGAIQHVISSAPRG